MSVLNKIIIPFLTIGILSSCATIIGGSNYYAHVNVENHPNATIFRKTKPVGIGTAVIKVRRKEANKLTFTIREKDCEEQTFSFRRRKFRGYALAGSILSWSLPLTSSFSLPIGLGVDFWKGSFWKPDKGEYGVTKKNFRHYNYLIEYTGCENRDNKDAIDSPVVPEKSLLERAKIKADLILEKKKMLDNGTITQEEYDKEKARIMEEK